jgi:nicotinamidase-related amidase
MQTSIPTRIGAVDALIVVDVQNAFVSGSEAVPGHKLLVSTVGFLLTQARSANAPVIFLQNDGLAGAADEPFHPGWDLFFPPQPHEKIVRKKKDNGFDGTGLHTILTGLGIRTVAICGMLSEMCVAATARAALEHGYSVLLPHDAHATYDVPAGPGSEGVPAAMAARAAEWSLGDEIKICASVHDVRFAKIRNDLSRNP